MVDSAVRKVQKGKEPTIENLLYKVIPKKKPAKGGEEQRQAEAVKRMTAEERRKYYQKKRIEQTFENRRLVPLTDMKRSGANYSGDY